MSYFNDVERDLVIAARTDIAEGVVAIDLVSHNGRDLPVWTPGSHIDLILDAADDTGAGIRIERQYSLCGPPDDRSVWRVAVLRDPVSRGGSALVHDTLAVDQRVRVRGPRNHFPFEPASGGSYRFVAGGIGITALRAMATAAAAVGADWSLDYAGRSRRTMPFVEELVASYPDRVRIHAADEGHRLDVDTIAAEPADGTEIYVCGPRRLLDAFESSMASRPEALHLERFEAVEFGEPVWSEAFEVDLDLSGVTVTVEPHESVLDAIEREAPDVLVLSSCRRGTCGSCEVPVIDGDIEHRDSVLTPAERADSAVMMICVSRAACPRIVIDL